MPEDIIAGVDIGTVTIAVVLMDGSGSVVFRDYQFHNGNVYENLEDMVRKLPAQNLAAIGVVAEKGREFFTTGVEVNEQVAVLKGVKHTVHWRRNVWPHTFDPGWQVPEIHIKFGLCRGYRLLSGPAGIATGAIRKRRVEHACRRL
jgi:hypothetical protein